MTANSSGWGRCIFPEIRISLPETRRTSAVMLPPIVQVAALLATIAGLAGLAILGYSRFAANRLIAERDAAVIQAQTANAALRTDIAGLQEKIAAAARKRRETEDRLTAATNETAKLRDRLAGAEASLHALQVQQSVAAAPSGNGAKEPAPDARAAQLAETLDQTKLALRQAAAEGATLSARLSKTEADRADERAQYEATTKQLQSVIGELERELLRRSAVSRKLAAAEPLAGGTTGLAEGGGPGLAGVARILASAGVDVAQVFSRFGIDRGEGGPFVAPRKAAAPARPISPRQLAALRRLMQSLPLGTPVARYQIGSPFGARTDPLNGRPAVHTGIDFDAPHLSPVYATAPGTVVFAGHRGEYGKAVEIDHGDGIHTLYAHLHRVAVAVGEKVAARSQIGLLGTTGRSSGPHVHYEVLVNGEPQDPAKFINLARLVPAAAR
jgi:murein DD-endopeptidase MepM/ murein hydrolase activator NlpD